MTTIKVAELPPILRFTAAAKALGISRTTLDRWVAEQRVCKPRTLSPRIRIFATKELLASLNVAQERVPAPATPAGRALCVQELPT